MPVSDFFWSSLLRRWREEVALPADADPYRYYDLVWQVTIPNMDPHIRPREILTENQKEVIFRKGFGAIIRKKFALPMPVFLSFDTDSLD